MGTVQEGHILDSKYRVERVLGQGGMGMVLAATHLQLGTRVALKLLLPEICTNPEAVDRFLREARAAVRIQGEHVARVTDVGTMSSGEPYMVMEYLDGADLGQVLKSRGPMPVAEVVDYVLQACEAIAEAHALGIVHRDLKPANLFLSRRPDCSPLVKVLDFGISKNLRGGLLAESASATASAVIMGSPQYMSPEQTISSKDVDARTDIWALGIILHELLTGQPMFQGESPTAVLIMISTAPPVPLRSVRPDAPVELERVILKCVEKDRTRRFVDVAALARALGAFGSNSARTSADRISRILGVEDRVEVEPFPPSPPSEPGPATGGPWGNTQRSVQRPRYRLIAGGIVAACAVLAVVAFFAIRSGDTVSPTDSSARPVAASPPSHEVQNNAPPAPAAEPPAAPIAPVPAAATPREAASAEPPSKSKPVVEPAAARPAEPKAESAARSVAPKAKPKPAPAPAPAPPRPAARPTRDLFDDPK